MLARDRAGKKPLFYYRDDGLLAFASEIKAFFAHPDIADRARSGSDPVLLHLRLRAAARRRSTSACRSSPPGRA